MPAISAWRNTMSLEDIVETEMRFSALEYMVNHLFVAIYQAMKADKVQIDTAHRELLQKAALRTFPMNDAALSDAAAAGFEEALRQRSTSRHQ
jgi:2-oxo-4-hydroxy-4-carboxy--5-ureidoimidazoline (OHCU) decarboxylase